MIYVAHLNMDWQYLVENGRSVIPILQSICQWAGIFYKEDGENEMVQCQKCDHHR